MDWKPYIHADPPILVGKPLVRGTRLSVEFILQLFATGWTEHQVLESYPALSPEALRAVFAFAAERMREERFDSLSAQPVAEAADPHGWPPGFFASTFGALQDDPLTHPEEAVYPQRGRTMVAIDKLRRIVEGLLTEYARIPASNAQEVAYQTVFDRAQDHYLLLAVGWQEGVRVHNVVLHLDITGGKVWLQANNTDQRVAEELVRAEVGREQIVLGLQPPELRPYTDYATT